MRFTAHLAAAIVVAVVVLLLAWPQAGQSQVVFHSSRGEARVLVEIADSPEERARGLMFRKDLQGGMLFVFEEEEMLGFWMKNTITALDIAFARMDGRIVTIHTMPPLTLRTFPSLEPVMFALEVKAGTFQRLGIVEGDRIDIPADVFKTAP